MLVKKKSKDMESKMNNLVSKIAFNLAKIITKENKSNSFVYHFWKTLFVTHSIDFQGPSTCAYMDSIHAKYQRKHMDQRNLISTVEGSNCEILPFYSNVQIERQVNSIWDYNQQYLAWILRYWIPIYLW
jgi:hypothetical protein